jgi:hypothetical protein
MAKVVSSVPKLLTGILSPGHQSDSQPMPVAASGKTDAEKAAEAEEALAQRRRGHLGTIATSFRGVLDNSDLTAKRHTLLGE